MLRLCPDSSGPSFPFAGSYTIMLSSSLISASLTSIHLGISHPTITPSFTDVLSITWLIPCSPSHVPPRSQTLKKSPPRREELMAVRPHQSSQRQLFSGGEDEIFHSHPSATDSQSGFLTPCGSKTACERGLAPTLMSKLDILGAGKAEMFLVLHGPEIK